MTRNRISEMLLSGLVLVGCLSETPTWTEPEATPGTVTVEAAQELRSSVRRPELAFRPAGEGFRAGFATHDVQITGGVIEMTPVFGSERGQSIRFETHAVVRGGVRVAELFGPARVTALGEVAVDRGAVVEEIENREEGVEQRWHFESAPAGDGALEVRVGVSGHDRVERSDHGLHFFASDGLGFRYSHARWIDSAGGAWDLPAIWDEDHIVIRVPQPLMQLTAYPAVLDPTIESESGVDDLFMGNLGEAATGPYIATRNDTLFAVWADRRVDGKTEDIYASRVSASGGVLDARGIQINGAAGAQTTPVAARVGTNWVVAWHDAGDIVAATVNDSNVVTQLGNVAATAAVEQLPAIAGQGSTAVLAWQSDGDIQASVFTGTFGAPFTIAATGATELDPAVAASSAGFLVVWADGTTSIKGQMLTTAGALTGGVIEIGTSTGTKTQPTAAFNGTDYVVVFSAQSNVFGARVSTAGVVVDAPPIAITVATGLQHQATVSCDPASCLVMYTDSRAFGTTGYDVFAQRVNFDLTPAGAEFPVQTATRDQVVSSVARAGSTGWVGIWQDHRTGGISLIMGTRISGVGVVATAAGTVITTNYAAEREAATSTNGTQHFVVWADSRSLGNDLRGVRYSSISSGRLDIPALTVSSAANDQASPTLSFDGTNYLAVWSDARGVDRDIFATRVSTGGVTLEPAGIPVATATRDQHLPDVASGGGVSLVVWMDRRNGFFDIFGAIITNGVVTTADIAISTAANDQDAPAVAFDPAGGVFVVVWSDKRGPGVSDIYGARVTTAGVVLDPSGVLVSGAQNAQATPDIAVSQGVIMAVWDDRRSDSTGDIFGTRLNSAGGLNVLDPGGVAIQFRPVGARQNSPSIIGLPTTNAFVVVWVDHRDSGTNGSDIYGQELTIAGQPTTALGFAIATSTASETKAKFQNDPNTASRIALVYQYFRTNFGTTRVYRRLMRFP